MISGWVVRAIQAGDNTVSFKINISATTGNTSFLHRIDVHGGDWVHVIKTLNDSHAVNAVSLRVDPGGVVEARAETEAADFVIYMPTMRDDEKGYNNRAFSKFHQPAAIIDISGIAAASSDDEAGDADHGADAADEVEVVEYDAPDDAGAENGSPSRLVITNE